MYEDRIIFGTRRLDEGLIHVAGISRLHLIINLKIATGKPEKISSTCRERWI